jgi:uncharacterized protein (TIGR02246 family)
MRKHVVSFVGLSLLFACAFLLITRPSIASPQDAKTKALIALDSEWSHAAEARNVDALVSYYADDAVIYPPESPKVQGREAIRKVWAGFLAQPTDKIAWKAVTAGVDGNTGWTAGSYADASTGPDGKIVPSTGKYLCIWHKGTDGKWKVVHDMWNTDSK